MKTVRRLTLLLGLFVAALAQAAPITFIHTGLGSGTLAGNPFAGAAFTITSTGDTDDRVAFASGFFIDHLTSTIDIAGIGVLTFITGTRTFVNNSGDIVGFSRAGLGGVDLYNGPQNVVFDTWDMLTSIGPIAGAIGLLQWGNSPVNTSGGVLFFESGPSSGFFQAIVGNQVPEPGTLALAGIAILALSLARRRSIR
jgi:PEP-CTERM motif